MDKKKRAAGNAGPAQPSVQMFTTLAEMKFKPANTKGSEVLAVSSQTSVDMYDPLSMVHISNRKVELTQPRRLKFTVCISNEHFLIGNENQLDMIGFGSIAHDFVDTDYYWSLGLKGPIENVIVDIKHSLFLILSQSTLFFYRYNLKSRVAPEPVAQCQIKPGVRFIRFLKDVMLGVFYEAVYEIYNVENLPNVSKRLEKTYHKIPPNCRLLTIPPGIDNIINVFFEEVIENKQSFVLWCLEIAFDGERIQPQEPYRVYNIMNQARGRLSVQNYTRDIIFMNLKNQIMAIKNGYLIDTVNVAATDDGGGILRYIHPETILHITKKTVEVYHFSIDMTVKPEKILLKSVDAVELKGVPEGAFFVSVLEYFRSRFAVFYEDSLRKHKQSRGEISYYFYVSQPTPMKEKIRLLFESIASGTASPEVVEEKYTVAKKMGLTEKEIYLEIWSRSSRSTIEDYQYILATRDYKLIKLEIEKKLKKESMVLREILRIEEGCMEINRVKVESIECSEEDLQDYVSSHFLMKKLKLFKDISVFDTYSSIVVNEEGAGETIKLSLKMNIQQYYHYKDMDIKAFLVEQITDMLFNFKNNARIIRMILKHFKFNYRIIYPALLHDIVLAAKDELINLLNEIPELLPYVHRDLNEHELRDKIYGGIWGEISEDEWEGSLYPEQLETLHNRPVLKEFLHSVWFKRWWLTGHDTLSYTRKEIEEINLGNNSEKMFYAFIAAIYEAHKDSNKPFYYQTVTFLEERYEFFPEHLRGKGFLYENLYIYYYNEEKGNANSRCSFAQFLEMDDERLFKYYFDHEKIKKNCLLREIKPIYEQSDVNGAHIFNIGLFSYFFSSLSQISDLKYILNRINNEKTEFHKKNYGIYEVLVRSMQLKLKLGSPNDIPIDEVLIYISNIPLDPSSQVMSELAVMEQVREESKRFIDMKINMCIKEIMENYQIVLSKVLDYEIQKRGLRKINQWDKLRREAFSLLTEVNDLRERLYPSAAPELTLLFFMSSMLEEEGMIAHAALLLIEEELHELFHIEERTIENIVLYMYKWKFSQNSRFADNAPYLKKLMELLPTENTCRLFLQAKTSMGLLLSSPEDPMEYPLSENSVCPTIDDFKRIFRFAPKHFLRTLEITKLYELVERVEGIAYKNTAQEKEVISLHKLEELLFVELLEKELYWDTIDIIYRILEVESPVKDVGIIYVMLFIRKLANEFNDESRRIIFRLAALQFYRPKDLLATIEKVIKSKLTGLEQSRFLREKIDEISKIAQNYNPENPILSTQFTKGERSASSIQLVENYRAFLKSRADGLEHNHEYDLAFTIMCNSPYLLAKFIDLQHEHISYKTLRSYLTMLSHREIFSPVRTYEVIKRVFGGLVMSWQEHKEINGLIVLMSLRNAGDEYPLPKWTRSGRKEREAIKCAQRFDRFIHHHNRRNQEKRAKLEERRRSKLAEKMKNTEIVMQEHIEFEESDKKSQITEQKVVIKKRPKVDAIPFEPIQERKRILERTVNFQQFLLGKELLIIIDEPEESGMVLPDVDLNKRKSDPSAHLLHAYKAAPNNYLDLKQTMIGRLHSHKVVMGSEYPDDHSVHDDDFVDLNLTAEQMSRSSGDNLVTRPVARKISQADSFQDYNEEPHNLVVNIVEPDLLEPEMLHAPPPAKKEESEELRHLKEMLVKTYNDHKIPKFDLSALTHEIQDKGPDDMAEYIAKFVEYLYKQHIEEINMNLKLIEEIGRKYPESKINLFFLQCYQRVYNTHEKYGLDLDITALLPISSVFIKSKNIMDLYDTIQPFVKEHLNDENVFKLSKLIALGLRKNVVEQEILFHYLKNLLKNYCGMTVEELEQEYEKIRSIMHKLPNQLLAERGEELFNAVYDCDRKKQLAERYIESLKSKGYPTAARDLADKLL